MGESLYQRPFTVEAVPIVLCGAGALLKECFTFASAVIGLWNTGSPGLRPDGYAMVMSPNKGGTAVHGCHYPDDIAVRMHEVLVRPWVGVCMPLALSLPKWRACSKAMWISTYGIDWREADTWLDLAKFEEWDKSQSGNLVGNSLPSP